MRRTGLLIACLCLAGIGDGTARADDVEKTEKRIGNWVIKVPCELLDSAPRPDQTGAASDDRSARQTSPELLTFKTTAGPGAISAISAIGAFARISLGEWESALPSALPVRARTGRPRSVLRPVAFDSPPVK